MTRTALRKSLLIAPAEEALRKADSLEELQEAWADFCSGFMESSAEYRELLRVYLEQVPPLREREAEARKYVRLLRTL